MSRCFIWVSTALKPPISGADIFKALALHPSISGSAGRPSQRRQCCSHSFPSSSLWTPRPQLRGTV